MYIILKTDRPEDFEIINKSSNDKAHFLYAETIEEIKLSIEDLHNSDDYKHWSTYYAAPAKKYCEGFNNYLKETILDKNRLSKKQIEDLCDEYMSFLPEKFNQEPKIVISKEADIDLKINHHELSFYNEWSKLKYIIDRHTQTKNNIYSWDKLETDFNPVRDLGINIPIKKIGKTEGFSGCGALNNRYYKLLFYFDYLNIHIPDRRLRAFWQFYKKTMDVYAIQYNNLKKEINVIPKPEEIYMQDEITHCIYDKLDYYCDGVKVPYWLYESKKEDLNINDFYTIKNADTRTIFIKKAGIENFIEKGEIIDSWENYPDNEWWAKSEYKLIDMKDFFVKKIMVNSLGREIRHVNYKYAPFLYMKNQTTGEYHMEGVSPDCKDLYDALKMRYDLLDLSEYKIEDIK